MAECIYERNKLWFARSRLHAQDLFDHSLLTGFEEHFAKRIQDIVTQGEAICSQANEMAVGDRAQTAWNEMWDHTLVLLNTLADGKTVDEAYVAQPFTQASPLDSLFFRYLNRQYRLQ